MNFCLRLEDNFLNAVENYLKHIRTTSWKAPPCPPRDNFTSSSDEIDYYISDCPDNGLILLPMTCATRSY